MLEVLESRLLLSSTWFVATNGLDNSPGTISQPFKTIQHAALIAQPGDTVFIRGGTYRETVTPAHSGTASAPITYSAYNNEAVTIDGANLLSGWTRLAGANPIYYANDPSDLGTGFNQVFLNGASMNEAQWPNTAVGAVRPGTATITSVSNSQLGTSFDVSETITIAVSGLPGGAGAWDGATIHFGAGQSWATQTGTVLHSGNGTLTFAYQHHTNYETPTPGNKIYLTGKFLGLDAPGEWYRDSATGRVYFWTPTGSSPANYTVEAKTRQNAFDLSNRSYLNIRNIKILGATLITNAASSHISMSGLTVNYVSQRMLDPIGWPEGGDTTGILILGSFNTLQSSTISHSSGNEVFLGGSNNIVENCTLAYADYTSDDSAAITMIGASDQIIGNGIHDTGRDGILDTDATACKIEYNTIYNIGLQNTDLGGIYDYGTNGGGTIIAYNNISNIHTGGFGAAGVYLDNGSSNYVVHNNTINNVQIPIKLHAPSYNISVYNNTINGKVVANQSSAGGSAAQGALTYHGPSSTLTTLGTLGGFQSNGLDINNAGQVVGDSLATHTHVGFLYSGGTLSAINALASIRSAASAINNSGQIAGRVLMSNGSFIAYLDTNGSVKTLGTLPGDFNSYARAINAGGQVAGVSYGLDAIGNAFLYSGGVMHSLGTLGGTMSDAYGINDAGTVVGNSTIAGDADTRAFSWLNGKMTNLGTLGGRSSYAYAINNAGQIAGTSQIAGNSAYHAFLITGGKMHDLGTLAGYTNSVATGINSAGEVVGYAYNADTSTTHGWVYRNGVMTDLNKLTPANTGWTLLTATAINDKNQITGTAIASSLREPAFVLSLLG